MRPLILVLWITLLFSQTNVSPAPVQRPIEYPETMARTVEGWAVKMRQRASISIRGTVLSQRSYEGDFLDPVSPCDLAVGWGELIYKGEYQKVGFYQTDRTLRWVPAAGFSRSGSYIRRHVANIHVVPTDAVVLKIIHGLVQDDSVILVGYLVDLTWNKGGIKRHIETSLSRLDGGWGSSEIMLVTSAEKLTFEPYGPEVRRIRRHLTAEMHLGEGALGRPPDVPRSG